MEVDRRGSYRIPIDPTIGRNVVFYPVKLFGRLGPPAQGQLVNVSTDGASVLVHAKLRKRKKIWMQFQTEGPLRSLRVLGQAVWVEKTGAHTRVGLRFLDPSAHLVSLLGRMAYDYKICEAGMTFSLKEVCKRSCSFWSLCKKKIKLPA